MTDGTPEDAVAAPAAPVAADVDVIDADAIDLDTIEADLADVELALVRLDSGAYWTDEVTGEPLPDELLERRPAARRA